MAEMRRFAMWIIDNVYIGRAAPWVFGFAIGRWPHKKEGNDG